MVKDHISLPNGQRLTVSPVFGGLFFKSDDLNTHHAAFPPGWTIILQSEDDDDDEAAPEDTTDSEGAAAVAAASHGPGGSSRKHRVRRFRTPTRKNDALYISSISSPSNSSFKPATSQSRQIAMMLWATLYYYFHQPPPNPHLTQGVHTSLPEAARPKGEWIVHVKREGIFKARNLLPKMERMGLLSSQDSCVGSDPDDRSGEGWREMFAGQRSFWQLDPRIYLFTLSPTPNSSCPFPSASPYSSRPSSPSRDSPRNSTHDQPLPTSSGLWSPTFAGPFNSSSHLPTYYPPPPTQYVMTSSNVRHPLRPKPPRQGETFYTRYIPRFDSFLSFRVASLSAKAPAHHGPTTTVVSPTSPGFLPPNAGVPGVWAPSMPSLAVHPSDTELLHKWMNVPRVAAAWGAQGPVATQEAFLKRSLDNRHSFPVIGCWDGKPFGYFEVYWVREDQLGRYAEVGHWDRGFHVLVGEEEFRGQDRIRVWLDALVHYCWLADQRTERVFLEPRVDNERFIGHLQRSGFYKKKEIAFPFKQAALMAVARESWVCPAI